MNGLKIKASQAIQLEIFKSELSRWAQRINLLSKKDRENIDEHIIDAILPMTKIQLDNRGKWADLGSGNGIPAIPLLIMLDQIEVDLFESSHKKAIYLKDALQKLKIDRAKIYEKRVELIGHEKKYRETYDYVMARAFTPFPNLINWSLPLVKVGGNGLFYLGENAKEVIANEKNFIKELGGKIDVLEQIRVTYSRKNRYVILINKRKNSPRIYPLKRR